MRKSIQTVNSSSCGAAIDLRANSACPFCHLPIAILDLKQQQQMLAQLKEAAAARPVDPMLPMNLAMANAQASAVFDVHDTQWWEDAQSGDLVQAGLNAVAR